VARSIKQIASTSPLTISSTFNSLFKVLFTFRSHYLFAIGLVPIFSFRWNLSPVLELQSQTTRLEDWLMMLFKESNTGISPSMLRGSCSLLSSSITTLNANPYTTIRRTSSQILSLSFTRFPRRYWEYRVCFLFLSLLICLNSGGNLAWFEVYYVSIYWIKIEIFTKITTEGHWMQKPPIEKQSFKFKLHLQKLNLMKRQHPTKLTWR
jgi:hypothetical protein